jgi:nickel/cobalt transporter (NiCoT) family protein
MRRSIAGMAATVIGLHVVGVVLLIVLVSKHGGALFAGTGIAAYTLGLRHAFDADHICAIDNTTRKLMAEGKRPLSVGFWFSLGHSTVVFALACAFAAGVRALGPAVRQPDSQLHNVTSLVGTTVSGGFLYILAAINVAILWGIVRTLRRSDDQAMLEITLAGPLNRVFGRFARAIREPRQMYPVGILFGLGFDTASEIALLVLAVGAAGAGLPLYAILCLPILFAAGMALLDTIDGSFMNFAYGWAFATPARKVFYNLVITGLSVSVAVVVGTIELAGVIAERAGAQGSFWSWLEHSSTGALGFIIVGLFVATWGLAVLVWRLGRVEERWSAQLANSDAG